MCWCTMVYDLRSKRVYAARKRAVKRFVKRRGYVPSMAPVLRGFKPEVKTVDVLVTTNILSTTATFTTLNGTALGTEVFQRIGRKIRMKSIHIRGRIIRNAAIVQASDDYARVIVFYDSEGTTSTLSDVLESDDATGATASNVTSFTNTANFSRFKILSDTAFTLPITPATAATTITAQSGGLTDYKSEANYNKFINLNMMMAEFGAGGAISHGGLQLMTVGSSIAVAAPHSIQWYARLRYYDI